jgi:hypothetical protein
VAGRGCPQRGFHISPRESIWTFLMRNTRQRHTSESNVFVEKYRGFARLSITNKTIDWLNIYLNRSSRTKSHELVVTVSAIYCEKIIIYSPRIPSVDNCLVNRSTSPAAEDGISPTGPAFTRTPSKYRRKDIVVSHYLAAIIILMTIIYYIFYFLLSYQ